jgi:hypothetical protein
MSTMASTFSRDDDIARRAIRDIERVSDKGWGRVPCPFCLSKTGKLDRRRSFGFNIDSGEYHCFKCGIRGRLLSERGEVKERIVDRRDRSEDPELGPPDGYTPLWREPGLGSMVFEPALKYLARRGVGSQTIEEARIGACVDGRLRGRVVVPAFDDGGEWYGWVARLWNNPPRGSRTAKYLTADGMDTYRRLFNESALDVETDDPLILVEGVYDALPLWPEASAFFGKPADGQFDRLCSARRPLVVALDGDAWIEAEMLALRLSLQDVRAGWLKLPPTRDPGDMAPSKILAAARSAIEQ